MNVFECTFPGCDTFPFDRAEELAEHLLSAHTGAADPVATVARVFPGATVVDDTPRTTVRSFSPGGTRATVRPRSYPAEVVPNCRWTKIGDDWAVRGPAVTLNGSTTVTVENRSGETKSVEIDPTTVRPDARNRFDRCDMAVARPKPKPKPAEVPEGIHIHDGNVYKVQRSGAGRQYAKVLRPAASPTAKRGSWDYVGNRPLAALSADTLADAEKAAEYGHAFGVCCNCGALLTDPKSIARGIGPICAGKF